MNLLCAQLNMRMISCALQLHYFTIKKQITDNALKINK